MGSRGALMAAALMASGWCGPIRAFRPWGPRAPSPRARKTPNPVREQRARDKRHRRQRERRRVALGGLRIWLVGTVGEYDWELVAALNERQARQLYVDHAGLSKWEVGDLTVKRAEWSRAVEHEPIVTEAKVLWSEMSARLPTDEPARFGWGFWHDDDPECEECNERVESVSEHQTESYAMLVCRDCLVDLGGAR